MPPVDPVKAAWDALDADLRDVIAEGAEHQFLASPDYAIARHRPLIEAALLAQAYEITDALAARPAPPLAEGELREAATELSDFLYDGIGWIEHGPTGMSVADGERLEQLGDALRAALRTPDAPADGMEPFIEFGNGERISGSVAKYKTMHPFGPICGVIWPGGPNGEPLACGYPQNPPGERMHEHSWSWVPTVLLDAPADEPPAEPTGGLDVERLARALDAHMAVFTMQPESFDSSRLVAESIAAEYLRLGEARDDGE